MNKLIFCKYFVKVLIHHMRLVWICTPSSHKLKSFILYILPSCLFYIELPCYFVPSLLPVYPRVQNTYCHIIYPRIASDQSEPILLHTSQLILILY